MANRTTMSLSIQTIEKLNALKDKLESALESHHVKLSLEDVIKVLLDVRQLDDVLLDLCLGKQL